MIQTNAFLAMPENIIVRMVTDPRLAVRRDSPEKIMKKKKKTGTKSCSGKE